MRKKLNSLFLFLFFLFFLCLFFSPSHAIVCEKRDKNNILHVAIDSDLLFKFLEGWASSLEDICKNLLLNQVGSFLKNSPLSFHYENELIDLQYEFKNIKTLDTFKISHFEFKEVKEIINVKDKEKRHQEEAQTQERKSYFKMCLKDMAITGEMKASSAINTKKKIIFVNDRFKAFIKSEEPFCLEAYNLDLNYSLTVESFFKTDPELNFLAPKKGSLQIQFTSLSSSHEKIENFQLEKLFISFENPLWKETSPKTITFIEKKLIELSRQVQNRIDLNFEKKEDFEKVDLFKDQNQVLAKDGTLFFHSLSLEKKNQEENLILKVDICHDTYLKFKRRRKKGLNDNKKQGELR